MDIPTYDDLPVSASAPDGSSWGVWGQADVLGCLNLIGAESLRAAWAEVRDFRTYSLDLPLDLPDPPLFGRPAYTHIVNDASLGHDDVLTNLNPQSSSQWDGFRHVRHPRYGYYNGISDADHGVHHWAAHGVVTRGVLADVARWRAGVGRPLEADTPSAISVDDLSKTLESQDVEVRRGDILLVRTGWTAWYLSLDASGRARLASQGAHELAFAGLKPGRETARYLWNLQIAAIAADNPALEVWPRGWPLPAAEISSRLMDGDEEVFLHTSLLPLLGMPIGELWNLEALARACDEDRRYGFVLVSAPIHQAAGVASPPNAVAIR